MTKSPLKDVAAKFGDKDKLVEKLAELIELGEESKDEFKSRIRNASNSKLLKLHTIASEIKSSFGGSREKLVDAILTQIGRVKDGDYRNKLLTLTPGRLLDMYKSASKRAKASAKSVTKSAKTVSTKAKTAAKSATKAVKKPAAKKSKA